ncbi:matrixin family metalloprotease, partial [Ruegeria lacuscaerulensis]|uniref:matrixin family metalloprotease n=1 Tax=Ruegeria lacuscaerulensis TaxID=55218 RepID=UPI001480BDEB
MTTFIPGPSSASPLSAIQGDVAYGDGNPNTTTVITYNFDQYLDSQSWTESHKADFRAALTAIEAVANVQFVEVSSWLEADIYEIIAPSSSSFFGSSSTLGYHYTPSNSPSEGAFNTDFWTTGLGGNGDPGGFFFTTLLHELGHALGLGHPHDTGLGTTVLNGVTSPFFSYGDGNLNQGVFTVMSYNDGWTQVNGQLPVNATYGGSTGLGALDIAALQAMYGANTTYNSGANTYDLASFNTAGVGYQAIWDTGGIDTIRHTGSAAAIIDLRPATLDYSPFGGGAISYVDGVQGGFTIAYGVVIENASGGSGSDTITGNAAVNTLNGNGGNDIIYSLSDGSNNNTINGGTGHDTIYVANGTGQDTVDGGEGNDTAIVQDNNGSFTGGTGFDIVRFISGLNTYLFQEIGSTYTFYNVLTQTSFTVSSDVELFEFSNGSQSYNYAGISSATQILDIENTGTVLQHASHGIYLLGGGNTPIAITVDSVVVGDETLDGWSAIQAEAAGSGGYRLLWKTDQGNAYFEWILDDQGVYVSGQSVGNVVDVEAFYNVDLNDDDTIGHVTTPIES